MGVFFSCSVLPLLISLTLPLFREVNSIVDFVSETCPIYSSDASVS